MTIIASRGSDQFPLRLPQGMREALKAKASENGRSLNSEITDRLARSLSEQPDIADIVTNAVREALKERTNEQG